MQFDTLTGVVIMANVLGAAMAVPQAYKLLRSRRVAGVSLTWAVISAVVNAWWGVYGIGVDDISIVPVSVVSVGAYLVIAMGIVRYGPMTIREAVVRSGVVVAAVSTLPLAVLFVEGWAAAGVALGALYGVQLSPAVVAVYRTADVTGVSGATWLIAFVEAILWGVYGWARVDFGLLALATTGTVMSSLVLARLILRRPRRRTVPSLAPEFAVA